MTSSCQYNSIISDWIYLGYMWLKIWKQLCDCLVKSFDSVALCYQKSLLIVVISRGLMPIKCTQPFLRSIKHTWRFSYQRLGMWYQFYRGSLSRHMIRYNLWSCLTLIQPGLRTFFFCVCTPKQRKMSVHSPYPHSPKVLVRVAVYLFFRNKTHLSSL